MMTEVTIQPVLGESHRPQETTIWEHQKSPYTKVNCLNSEVKMTERKYADTQLSTKKRCCLLQSMCEVTLTHG